jgi:hypothetical protein
MHKAYRLFLYPILLLKVPRGLFIRLPRGISNRGGGTAVAKPHSPGGIAYLVSLPGHSHGVRHAPYITRKGMNADAQSLRILASCQEDGVGPRPQEQATMLDMRSAHRLQRQAVKHGSVLGTRPRSACCQAPGLGTRFK